MELVNFAREDLGTTITSSCVYDDNYPPSNLIATDRSLRSRGYRVEHFIRPPIQLQLDFAVPIRLQSICIQLGQLSEYSTSVNLFLPRTTVPMKICSDIVLKGNSVIRLINRDLSDELIKPQTALGSFLHSEKEEGKLSNPHTLLGVTSLILKIVHSSSYQPPAVKNLEVWGLFDHQRRYNKEKIQKYYAVVKTWQKIERSEEYFVSSMYISGAKPTHSSQQLGHHSSTLDTSQHIKSLTTEANDRGQSFSDRIPDKYLDEITYEIMLVPMLLPSGHYVDQSTIDKFTSTENAWGRPGADPFTGVPFSSAAKPKFCANLKTQIDKFVTQNRHELSNLGNTLGDADQIEKHLHKKKRQRVNIDGDETPERKKQNLPQSDD
ncbi:RING finger protein 37-like [Dysidea avara]|uniref:RING finger protein 37-like n=1 Tax=Dysidea avara TaxID=196820 RepID=UPI003330181A